MKSDRKIAVASFYEGELEKVDAAAAIVRQNRSQFISKAALDAAKRIGGNDD